MDLAPLIFSGKLIPQAPSLLMLLLPEFPSICHCLCSTAEPGTKQDGPHCQATGLGHTVVTVLCPLPLLTPKVLVHLQLPPVPTVPSGY